MSRHPGSSDRLQSRQPLEQRVGASGTRGGSGDRRTTLLGVLGELLVTAGVLVLLFIAWQLWFNDVIATSTQTDAAASLSETWLERTAPESPAPDGSAGATPQLTHEPVVMATPERNETWGVLFVPRWGADYARPVAEGTALRPVLNEIGIGHYVETQLPGEVGNVALAAHRNAYGAPFGGVPDLRVGDAIVLQTADGWYTYRFRNLEYVKPSGVGVLNPVPQSPRAAGADERYITLTTCNPLYSVAERVAAYGVFESFHPTAGGPPASLAAPEEPAASGPSAAASAASFSPGSVSAHSGGR
ncbi:class E sortase [Ruicaihuangia caeni]|uniref:Class E sortase n=1 Tax=Ruicaihuangia caeni TaxID=3042517 RepID=A0AAW6TBD8_9MICO|nr:class E sortase [Klugiella sp. YN-L-19]MDI2099153.1 class E sortase [Klugiella sp. YN-L-19]